MSTISRRANRAFTLVELLVVIAIITILSAIASIAVVKVVASAKQQRVVAEILSIDQGFHNFKMRHGVFPPNFGDAAVMKGAWSRMFTYANPTTDAAPTTTYPSNPAVAGATPDQALVYWLYGFSANTRTPLSGKDFRQPLFPFDKGRLYATSTKQQVTFDPNTDLPTEPCYYVPDHPDITNPYLYFDTSRGSNPAYKYDYTNPAGVAATIKPYVSDASNGSQYMRSAASQFQIICPGVDNDYGTGGRFPSGTGFTPGDADNLTNFTMSILRDAQP